MRSPIGGAGDARPDDVGALVAMLPDQSVARFAYGPTGPPSQRRDAVELVDAAAVARMLSDRTERMAFAWMSEPAGQLWDRWIAIAEGSALDATLAASGVTLETPDAVVERGGVRFARHGSRCVIAPREADLRAALERADRPRGAEVQAGLGSLDGAAAARAMQTFAARLPEADPRRLPLISFASLIGVARDLGFEAHVDPRSRMLVLAARMNVALAEEGQELIIDDVLRNTRNAIALPVALEPVQLRRGARWIIETDDAASVAERVFSARSRVRVEVLDPSRLQVEILPEVGWSSPPRPVPLEDSRRARLLIGMGSNAEQLRALARELVPRGASPAQAAEAVLHWVHEHIRYQLTAEELDAPSVLAGGRGDCSELSRLTVALLRAAGVPAEMREGFLVNGREAVAHAWVAFHDGVGFREIDPTNDMLEVSAGLLPASVWSAISLISVGSLRVVEVGPLP